MSNANMEPLEQVNIVKSAWLEVMPDSHAYIGKALGSYYVKMYFQKPEQWSNGISQNDILHYYGFVTDGRFCEETLHLTVKPTKKHMVFGSVKSQKTSTVIKRDAMVKRFTKVRNFILKNNNLLEL